MDFKNEDMHEMIKKYATQNNNRSREGNSQRPPFILMSI
jgi:hypothetical protein